MTAEQLARMLVLGDYPEDEVRNVLLDRFPEQDPDDLIADARGAIEQLDDELAAAEREDARRALRAEHDNTQSMHDEPW